MSICKKDLERRGNVDVFLNEDRVYSLSVLSCDNDLHSAEGRGHGCVGNEEDHRLAVLYFSSQLVTEIVSGLAGLVVPDTVLSVVEQVEIHVDREAAENTKKDLQ